MSNISNITQDQLQGLGLSAPASAEKDKDTQTDFLELFVAQLRNQNPLEPQDGAQFLSQLAQFSTVEGIKNMESSFSEMATSLQSNQALQASNLVGRQVGVATDLGMMTAQHGMQGMIEVPSSVSNLNLEIIDSTGVVVKRLPLGGADEGNKMFSWNGLDDNGNAVNEGVYQIRATASIDGQQQNLNTFVHANVDSVTMGAKGQGVMLNVAGYGPISLNDIKTIS